MPVTALLLALRLWDCAAGAPTACKIGVVGEQHAADPSTHANDKAHRLFAKQLASLPMALRMMHGACRPLQVDCNAGRETAGAWCKGCTWRHDIGCTCNRAAKGCSKACVLCRGLMKRGHAGLVQCSSAHLQVRGHRAFDAFGCCSSDDTPRGVVWLQAPRLCYSFLDLVAGADGSLQGGLVPPLLAQGGCRSGSSSSSSVCAAAFLKHLLHSCHLGIGPTTALQFMRNQQQQLTSGMPVLPRPQQSRIADTSPGVSGCAGPMPCMGVFKPLVLGVCALQAACRRLGQGPAQPMYPPHKTFTAGDLSA